MSPAYSQTSVSMYQKTQQTYANANEITNRFAALETSNDDEDVNRTWENIKENIQILAKEILCLYELKQNWRRMFRFLDQRRRAKM